MDWTAFAPSDHCAAGSALGHHIPRSRAGTFAARFHSHSQKRACCLFGTRDLLVQEKHLESQADIEPVPEDEDKTEATPEYVDEPVPEDEDIATRTADSEEKHTTETVTCNHTMPTRLDRPSWWLPHTALSVTHIEKPRSPSPFEGLGVPRLTSDAEREAAGERCRGDREVCG